MRRSAREADDPMVPDWPVVHSCRRCGRAVWRASTPDGQVVSIDTEPLETEVVDDPEEGGGRRQRALSSYRFAEARGVGGWRLEEPVHVRGGDDAAWRWYCSRVPIEACGAQLSFSEHVFLCTAATRPQVISELSKLRLTGEAAGDPKAKARGAEVRIKKALARDALQRWAESGVPIPLPSELGACIYSARQMTLF